MKPTRRQLRYLRHLADATGSTFTYPKTVVEASQEITRLEQLPRSGRTERAIERRQVSQDLADRPRDATAIRASEVAGYGSTARWTHRDQQPRQPTSTRAVGERRELGRYRIPAGERALYAQRVDGRVALSDVPLDHHGPVYLIDRDVTSMDDLASIVAAYSEHSQGAGVPAVVAQRQALDAHEDA